MCHLKRMGVLFDSALPSGSSHLRTRRSWQLIAFRAAALIILLSGVRSSFARTEQKHQSGREQKILRIQQLIQEHELEKAQLELVEAAKQYPADEGFYNLLGIVAAQQGNHKAAEENFRRAIEKAPRFTGAYLNLGHLYQENSAADSQAWRKALAAYGRVLRYESNNEEANYQSAVLLLQQGEFKDSFDHVSHLSPQNQGSSQVLSLFCADCAGLGNRRATEDLAARLAAASDLSEPDVRQALMGLIPAKWDDLVVTLVEALQKRQDLSPALLQTLGLAYERIGKLAEARVTLEKSFTEGPTSVPVLLDLMRIARRQKDFQGALGYLAHAREIDTGNASVHYYFGLVCVDLNLLAEARNSFEAAVKLGPQNPDYNYAMGAASAFQRDPAEALPYFEKYIKLKPQDPRGKLAMGAALFRAKDYEHATPWLKLSAKIPATAARSHYYLGAIALEERRLDEAFAELQEALKYKPAFADALAELGQYYMMRREYKQAEYQIQLALKLEPEHYAANFYLLTLYTRTKDPRQQEQTKRFDQLKTRLAEKNQEFLRIVEVRPLETP
jgi:tetratricopeptide (TPR) repeat protein